MIFVNRRQRCLAVCDVDHFMAIPGQEFSIERANAFGVVRNEDAAPPRRGSDLRGEFDHQRYLRDYDARSLARTAIGMRWCSP